MKYDVIIIGSGLGGLECGCILSKAGMRVLVLERDGKPGGCMQSYVRHGLRFDTGFHYVGGLDEGQSLHAAFRHLGLLDLPWKRLDPFFDYVTIGGRTFPFAQGFDAFVDTLAGEFPGRRETLVRYADMLRRSCESQFDALRPDKDDLSSFSARFETGAYDCLDSLFHDELLLDVVSGASLKMELRRESLPLFTFLHGNAGFIESSWRLEGDGSLIAGALAGSIRAAGGDIVCHAEVTELVESGGRIACALCEDGTSYEADCFISDVHPALLCGMLKQSRKMSPAYRNRIARLENTFGMLTVSLALKPDTLPYFNCNHYVYRHQGTWAFYRDMGPVSGVLVSCRVPEGRYARQVDLLTPMTWDKCEAWSHTSVGRRGTDYEAMKKRMAAECVALAEQSIPGLRGMVAESYVSTPLTYRDYLHSPCGTAYGVRKDFNNPLQTLLSPRTPVPNLFLTGQNLVLHGVHGVTVTALLTCAGILGKEYIWNIINK